MRYQQSNMSQSFNMNDHLELKKINERTDSMSSAEMRMDSKDKVYTYEEQLNRKINKITPQPKSHKVNQYLSESLSKLPVQEERFASVCPSNSNEINDSPTSMKT